MVLHRGRHCVASQCNTNHSALKLDALPSALIMTKVEAQNVFYQDWNFTPSGVSTGLR